MSTISEALRKAQQQKTSGSLPDAGRPLVSPPDAGGTAVRRRAPAAHAGGWSPRRTAALLALGVSLLLAAALCVWIVRSDTAPAGSRARQRPPVGTAPAGKGATADAVAPTGSPASPPVAGIVPSASPAEGTSSSAPLEAPPSLRAESAPAAAPAAPTAASAAAPPPAPPQDMPALTGVFYSEVNPMAILAGETVKEGDVVGRYRVVKIEPESVTLTAGGESIVLRMKR